MSVRRDVVRKNHARRTGHLQNASRRRASAVHEPAAQWPPGTAMDRIAAGEHDGALPARARFNGPIPAESGPRRAAGSQTVTPAPRHFRVDDAKPAKIADLRLDPPHVYAQERYFPARAAAPADRLHAAVADAPGRTLPAR